MATAEECRKALEDFAAQLRDNSERVKGKANFERRLACDITDLSTSFHGQFSNGGLIDITEGDDPQADIRMIIDSDDLIALVNGELDFGPAFANGRVKLKASLMDLLKLKGMM